MGSGRSFNRVGGGVSGAIDSRANSGVDRYKIDICYNIYFIIYIITLYLVLSLLA